MNAQDHDDRDAEFTGILAQPLKPGEDPSLKLPKLYEALGVETAEAAVLVLARMDRRLKGFRPPPAPQRKRKTPGRPNLLSLMQEATGCGLHLPPFVVADLEERLFRRMETILAEAKECGRPIKVLEAAFCVIKEEEIDGHANSFWLDDLISRDMCDAFAKSVASLFTHRAKRRQRHLAAWEDLRASTEPEVRAWLKPLWPQILQETIEQTSQEAVDRVVAGERAEDVLEDVPKRALEIANAIVRRDWPL